MLVDSISYPLAFFIISLFVDVSLMMWNFSQNKAEHDGKYRILYRVVKILLVPLIAGVYLFGCVNTSKDMLFYLLFSWIGDIILLIKGIFPTAIGGIFFAAGHYTMVKMFHIDWSSVPNIAYLFMTPGLTLHYGYLMPKMSFKVYHGYCVLIYCTILELSTCSAAARLAYLPLTSLTFWLSYLGYIFFIISDYFLITVSLKLDYQLKRKEILGTYIAAQACLVLSNMIYDGPKEIFVQ